MKQQKLSNDGFIVSEAIVGVALFSLLLVIVLQGISFITQRVASVAHRHKALCAITLSLDRVPHEVDTILYRDPSVPWYTVKAQSGNQVVTLYHTERRS